MFEYLHREANRARRSDSEHLRNTLHAQQEFETRYATPGPVHRGMSIARRELRKISLVMRVGERGVL